MVYDIIYDIMTECNQEGWVYQMYMGAIRDKRKDNKEMKKTLGELQCEERILVSRINQYRNETASLQKRLDVVKRELTEKSLYEISDTEAPNAGTRWTDLERERVQEHTIMLVFNMAKRHGRSTHSIRFKVAEAICSHFTLNDWLKVWSTVTGEKVNV